MSIKTESKAVNVKVVKPEDFDLKKFSLNTVIDNKAQAGAAARQWTLFPKYKYYTSQEGYNVENEAVSSIYTEPIALRKCEISKLENSYCDCLWLSLDEEYSIENIL